MLSFHDGALDPLCKDGTIRTDHSWRQGLNDTETIDCTQDIHCNESAIGSFAGGKGTLHSEPPAEGKARRVVRFGLVRIREYGVTVGAYSAAGDSCPMQLTWEHSPKETCLGVEEHQILASNGDCSSKFPQRLSPNARRERIARVQGTTNLRIASLEFDLTLALIQETIKSLDGLSRRIHDNYRDTFLVD
jgi:hypothetical protein